MKCIARRLQSWNRKKPAVVFYHCAHLQCVFMFSISQSCFFIQQINFFFSFHPFCRNWWKIKNEKEKREKICTSVWGIDENHRCVLWIIRMTRLEFRKQKSLLCIYIYRLEEEERHFYLLQKIFSSFPIAFKWFHLFYLSLFWVPFLNGFDAFVDDLSEKFKVIFHFFWWYLTLFCVFWLNYDFKRDLIKTNGFVFLRAGSSWARSWALRITYWDIYKYCYRVKLFRSWLYMSGILNISYLYIEC